MRNVLLALPIISSCIASAVLTAASSLPLSFSHPQLSSPFASLDHGQVLMNPGIALPNPDVDGGSDPAADPATDSELIISDVLGRSRSISIFASLARDVSSVSKRLDDSTLNATVLAPTNAALAGLPRKPWEDPTDYELFGTTAYEGQEGEGRAQRNLRKFVEAHVAPISPWDEGQAGKVQTLAGNEVWVEERKGKKFVQPGNIEVINVADKVSNGQVWIIGGVLNYT